MILSNGVCMIAFVYDGVCLTDETSTTIEMNFYMKLISILNFVSISNVAYTVTGIGTAVAAFLC